MGVIMNNAQCELVSSGPQRSMFAAFRWMTDKKHRTCSRAKNYKPMKCYLQNKNNKTIFSKLDCINCEKIG